MPADAARAASNISTAADPISVTLPASVAGEGLLVIGRSAGTPTFNLPTGWFWVLQNNTADASDDVTSVIYKLADGSEGTTLSWDLSASSKCCCVAYRITDAPDPAENLPTCAVATSAAANIDPPAATLETAPNDYLIITAALLDHETATFTAPTNYTNAQAANSGTAGAVATNCQMSAAARALTWITAENPGAWTSTAPTTGVTGLTIAVGAPRRRTPGVDFRDPAMLMEALRHAWNRRPSGIFVPELPKLWVPEPV